MEALIYQTPGCLCTKLFLFAIYEISLCLGLFSPCSGMILMVPALVVHAGQALRTDGAFQDS